MNSSRLRTSAHVDSLLQPYDEVIGLPDLTIPGLGPLNASSNFWENSEEITDVQMADSNAERQGHQAETLREQSEDSSVSSSPDMSIIAAGLTYPWADQKGATTEEHIEVLEDAVKDAIACGKQLVNLAREYERNGSIAFPATMISDFEGICDEHEKFEVSVGICGVTGAGKTTMINALLGYNELLPSGSEEASTGSVCFIHENKDENKDIRFRASVVFKSRSSVKEWLDKFFCEFRRAKGLSREASEDVDMESEHNEAECFGIYGDGSADGGAQDTAETGESSDKNAEQGPGPYESQEDDGEQLSEGNIEMEDNFSEYTDPIYDVWKLEECDLMAMSTEDILTDTNFATGLLSTTKEIGCRDLEAFAEEIKPYLDCTALPGVETESGKEISVWPLVERVDLYVPSPILKNGVVIEDLPGLSDSVEMRANAARERFRKLGITVIVSPIIRACNEQQATQLITDNEAMHMELDGKFNGHKFCVVTSKIDDMPWKHYLKNTLRPSPGTDIHTAYKTLGVVEQQVKDVQLEIPKAKRLLSNEKATLKIILRDNGLGDEDDSDTQQARQKVSSASAKLAELRHQLKVLEERSSYLIGLLNFLCISARNERVKKKILSDMKRKQTRFRNSKQRPVKEAISILPVSSNSFWQLRQPDSAPLPGFPTVNYTGIPALSTWIRRATIPARETHALSMLYRLNAIFNVLLTWSMKESLSGGGNIGASKILLQQSCYTFNASLRENLRVYGQKVTKRVEDCNPLCVHKEEKKNFRPSCRPMVIESVRNWRFMWPDRPRDSRAMHWRTHAAIIRRHGGRYTSSGINKASYAWMENMADIVLLGIVEMWNDAFHRRLPGEAGKVKGELEEVWKTSMSKVRKVLPEMFPDQIDYLTGQLCAITEIQELVAQNVENAMFHVATQAADVHKLVGEVLEKGWKREFSKALRIKGKGTFARRQQLFVGFATQKTTPLIKIAMESMGEQIAKNIVSFQQSLDAIWADGMAKIDNQIDAICQRILPQCGQSSSAGDAGIHSGSLTDVEFRRAAKPLIVKWKADWTHPDKMSRMQGDRPETAIPKTYIAEPRAAIFDPPSSDGEDWAYRQPQPPKRRRAVRKRASNTGDKEQDKDGKRARTRTAKKAKSAERIKSEESS